MQKNHELELEKIDLLKAQETAPTLPDAQVSNPSQSAISDLVKEISRQNDLRELEKASSSGITKYQGENDMQRVVLEFPAPIVNVAAPDVRVDAPVTVKMPEGKKGKTKKMVITRDIDGKISGMEEEN